MRSGTARVALNAAVVLGAFVRDWLTIVGLSVATLAYAGAKNPDVFPFYVDAHLVGEALWLSVLPAVVATALRAMAGAWPLPLFRPAG